MAPLHSVSVAAVITNEAGEVLLIQRQDNGHWEPPGGVLELEESILDGLCREITEETGLLIEPERLTGIYKNMALCIVTLVFRARVVGGVERPSSDETLALEWVHPREVHSRCVEAFAVRVQDGLDNREPVIRMHDGIKII